MDDPVLAILLTVVIAFFSYIVTYSFTLDNVYTKCKNFGTYQLSSEYAIKCEPNPKL